MKLKNHYIELLVCVSDKLGQLVQRCVIVQKDEKGYGLTVSGDNPVFVQSVKDSMYSVCGVCVCVCVCVCVYLCMCVGGGVGCWGVCV